MAYPSDPFLMLMILRLSSSEPTEMAGFLDAIGQSARDVAPMDPESLLPERVDDDEQLKERLNVALRHLEETGIIEETEPGRFGVTERGRQLLERNPSGIDDTVLEQFVEFRHYLHTANQRAAGPTEPAHDYRDGFSGYYEGLALADNPYDPDTVRFFEWNAGWFEAFEEQLEHRRADRRSPGERPGGRRRSSD